MMEVDPTQIVDRIVIGPSVVAGGGVIAFACRTCAPFEEVG